MYQKPVIVKLIPTDVQQMILPSCAPCRGKTNNQSIKHNEHIN